MQISNLKLLNFRNYEVLDVNFSPHINLLYGLNGMGKTNLVEAIYILAFTKSFRPGNDITFLKKGKNLAKIEGVIKDNNITNKFKIIISDEGKRVKINSNNIAKLSDYISKINIVLFTREDLRIIKDTPSTRRKMLNIEISGLNKEYLILVNRYNKILKQRNAYIKTLQKKSQTANEFLQILTEQLISVGMAIMLIRAEFINNINLHISEYYEQITHKGTLTIKYISEYLSKTKDELLAMYQQNFAREIYLGKTILGIHHDDIAFLVNNEKVADYASSGEQKNAIIAFKLAEIKNIEQTIHKSPILILDDLFSEIDEEKINNIMQLISDNYQIFITTTEITKVNQEIINKAKTFYVKDGTIKEET